MAQKQKDLLPDVIGRKSLFRHDACGSFQPLSTYSANDLGKEIKLITDAYGKIITAGYLDAIKLAAAQGLHLPSNVLLDEYLIGSEEWRELAKKNCYVAWAREILAYPEAGGVFAQGYDITDCYTGWTLPANYVPAGAIGVKGVGLFIDPEEVREESEKIIIHPKTIFILMNLIQKPISEGKVDQITRTPLEVDGKLLGMLPESEKRRFWRISGVGVRPIVRDYVYHLNWKTIYCNYDPNTAFGVGGVSF